MFEVQFGLLSSLEHPSRLHTVLVVLLDCPSGFALTKVFGLVLTIFNEVAYLTFKSIFHKALNLF